MSIQYYIAISRYFSHYCAIMQLYKSAFRRSISKLADTTFGGTLLIKEALTTSDARLGDRK